MVHKWLLSLFKRAGNMARIKIENYNQLRHQDPMFNFRDPQRSRHYKAPTLNDYKVCLVSVCSFTFVFHSLEQLAMCLDYYRREHQPSSRLPVYSGNYGGDQHETQRWYDRLPQFLLEKPKRLKVVKALEQAQYVYLEALTAKEPRSSRKRILSQVD